MKPDEICINGFLRYIYQETTFITQYLTTITLKNTTRILPANMPSSVPSRSSAKHANISPKPTAKNIPKSPGK